MSDLNGNLLKLANSAATILISRVALVALAGLAAWQLSETVNIKTEIAALQATVASRVASSDQWRGETTRRIERLEDRLGRDRP